MAAAVVGLPDLPAPALRLIFGHLASSCSPDGGSTCSTPGEPEQAEQAVARLRLVCRSFADAARTAVRSATPKDAAALELVARFFAASIERVNLRHVRHVQPEQVAAAALGRLRALRALELPGGSWVRPPTLAALAGCAQLTALDVAGANDGALAQLAAALGAGAGARLRRLGLSGCISDAGLARLPRLPCLRRLSLTCCEASDAGLAEALGRLPRLASLQVHGCMQLGDATLRSIAAAQPALTSLALAHSFEDASGAGVLALGACSELRSLDLTAALAGGRDTAAALASLLSGRLAAQLTELHLSYCEALSPPALAAVAGMRQLRVLGVSGLPPACLHGLRGLRHLQRLEALSLRWVGQLRDSDAAFLRHLGLTRLDVAFSRGLTSAGLEHLRWSCTALRELNLMSLGGGGGGGDMPWLESLQELTALTVSSLPARCKAWEQLGGLPQLRALALRRCQLAGGQRAPGQEPEQEAACSLECLPRLTALAALDCSNSTIDQAAAAALGRLLRLQHLSLWRCAGVTDASLAALAGGGCPALRKLDVRRSCADDSCWTAGGLAAMLAALPGLCEVYASAEWPPGLQGPDRRRVLLLPANGTPPLPVARP